MVQNRQSGRESYSLNRSCAFRRPCVISPPLVAGLMSVRTRRSHFVKPFTLTPLEILFLATGFMGAWTLLYVARHLHSWFVAPPSVAVFHSPKGGCTDAAVWEIRRAKREVLVQAYSFTSKPIADALIEAKGRGVNIE